MKPVVPKVRVGEVLRGTRNLRNYLRLCSLFRYLEKIPEAPKKVRERLAKEIYSPRRDDNFLVTANNLGRFCVWDERTGIVVYFQNPVLIGGAVQDPILDKRLFANWFSRTERMVPDLNKWQGVPLYLWASLHMNALGNIQKALPIPYHHPLFVPVPGGHVQANLPFLLAQSLPTVQRTQIKQAVKEAIATGGFRGRSPNGKSIPIMGGHRIGPDIEHIPGLREAVVKLARNPRSLSKATRDLGEDKLKKLLESMKPYTTAQQ